MFVLTFIVVTLKNQPDFNRTDQLQNMYKLKPIFLIALLYVTN